ncbi:GspH/FimT family pseudopilin [Glaciimonas sp. CA11.2]|uniref:GspH/FimT family pseudopilin n=1 Tax=Glaciimonas sp. CA11.2 TaxID=3048601 RepID=UPI002AB5DBEF|nr:GspH/FimT family pseudopilin [Glaciimonas sp. CA11.2]MDY7546334.1 GspH/FimT family pseudopilin [Glaciimonas sp. CA11.2]MEB0161784.1 GspH/FimT family pseudopilin [Glaciimonas sp. CA11.2]
MLSPNKGFTLVELIITIAVVAILVAIALPSMRDFVTDIRVASNVKLFLAANRFARSEAIMRGRMVRVCAAYDIVMPDRPNIIVCRGGGASYNSRSRGHDYDPDGDYELIERDWSQGWIVDVSIGRFDTTPVIRLFHSLTSNSMTTITGSHSYVVYSATGALSASYRYTLFNVLFSPGTKFARRVCISVTGLARVVRKTGAADPVC